MNTAMAALFVTAAALQYNDPDPLRWMTVYGGAAVLSGLAAMDRFPIVVGAPVSAASLVASALLAPRALRAQGGIGEEIVNETMGLLLVTVWIGLLTVRAFRARRDPARIP